MEIQVDRPSAIEFQWARVWGPRQPQWGPGAILVEGGGSWLHPAKNDFLGFKNPLSLFS